MTNTADKHVGAGAVIGHTFLIFLTGGIWGIVLLVRLVLKKS